MNKPQRTQPSSAQLARTLINTKTVPPSLESIRTFSQEARAYHTQKPYPYWHFRDWNRDERGPLPRCLPLLRTIVQRGAVWLFGKPVKLQLQANSSLEAWFRTVWMQNRMDSRLVAMARQAALESGIALKFSIDETRRPSVTIETLSVADQVRFFYHPHRRDELLLARVQYRYYDSQERKWFWYREEWTEEEEVHYLPLEEESHNSRFNPDLSEAWVIASRAANPFGLIPVHHCRNLEMDDVWGGADLWDLETENGLYRTFDRLNLTFHLMDRSNQFDSTTNPIFMDAEIDEGQEDKPLSPGEAVMAKSDATGEGGKGQVYFPPSGNNLRPAMMEYATALRQDIMDAVMSVIPRPDEITNKGNLTTAVLKVIYQPQIEMTELKRRSLGGDGVCAFLGKMALGAKNAGVQLADINPDDPESYQPCFVYQDYFEPSAEEIDGRTETLNNQVDYGFTTRLRAARAVATMEGVEDWSELERELEPLHERMEREREAENQSDYAGNDKRRPGNLR